MGKESQGFLTLEPSTCDILTQVPESSTAKNMAWDPDRGNTQARASLPVALPPKAGHSPVGSKEICVILHEFHPSWLQLETLALTWSSFFGDKRELNVCCKFLQRQHAQTQLPSKTWTREHQGPWSP